MTNSAPQVSIIMAFYNEEDTLLASIESVLGQSFSDFELIVVDDASTDNSAEIVTKMQEQDRRIQILRNQQNQGLTKSLNIGIKVAKGKYIVRLDAGDIALPERLQVQYNFLEHHPEIFLVGSEAWCDHSEYGFLGKEILPAEPEELAQQLPRKNRIYHSAIMFRNQKIPVYREKFVYSQDYDLYLRLLSEKKKIANIPRPLIQYSIRPHSISTKRYVQQQLFAERARGFFHARSKTGKDTYDQFSPQEILERSENTSGEPLALFLTIQMLFKMEKFQEMRSMIWKYQRTFGWKNMLWAYYAISFLPRRFIRMMRKYSLQTKYTKNLEEK